MENVQYTSDTGVINQKKYSIKYQRGNDQFMIKYMNNTLAIKQHFQINVLLLQWDLKLSKGK
jgi:hypothetical protein